MSKPLVNPSLRGPPLVRGTDDRNASLPPLEARQRELCAAAQDPSPGVAASVCHWSSACRLLAGFGLPFAKWGTCLGSQVGGAARTASRKWHPIPTQQNDTPGRPWSCLPTSVRTDAPGHPNAAVAAATEHCATDVTRPYLVESPSALPGPANTDHRRSNWLPSLVSVSGCT